MRFDRVIERIRRGDRYVDGTRVDSRRESSERLRRRHAVERARGRAVRHRHTVWVGDRAAVAQRGDAAFERGSTGEREDRVDARRCDAARGRKHVVVLRIDGFVDAEPAQQLAALTAVRCRDHVRTAPLRELHRHRSDARCCAVHQHCLPGAQTEHVVDSGQRRYSGYRDRTRFSEIQ